MKSKRQFHYDASSTSQVEGRPIARTASPGVNRRLAIMCSALLTLVAISTAWATDPAPGQWSDWQPIVTRSGRETGWHWSWSYSGGPYYSPYLPSLTVRTDNPAPRFLVVRAIFEGGAESAPFPTWEGQVHSPGPGRRIVRVVQEYDVPAAGEWLKRNYRNVLTYLPITVFRGVPQSISALVFITNCVAERDDRMVSTCDIRSGANQDLFLLKVDAELGESWDFLPAGYTSHVAIRADRKLLLFAAPPQGFNLGS